MRLATASSVLVLAGLTACGAAAPSAELSLDAGVDAPFEAGVSASPEAGIDAPIEAEADASSEASLDAAPSEAAFEAAPPGSDAAPPSPAPRLYGVTADDVSNLGPMVTALGALPHRPTTRIVFDEGQAPSAYAQAVPAIHAVSDVMGELLDSQYVTTVTPAQYTQRTSDYLAAFPADVDVWEVANEINGNWLGATADVVAKMTGAFDLVKAAGKRTELTLYGCSDSGNQYDMFVWANANVPARMLAGLDYVLVSYYEGDCGAPRSDWPAVFHTLRQMFPAAGIGFGEVGATDKNGQDVTDPAVAGPYLQKYYGMSITEPGYVGGYFWWYFVEDMVPDTKAMFPVLAAAMK